MKRNVLKGSEAVQSVKLERLQWRRIHIWFGTDGALRLPSSDGERNRGPEEEEEEEEEEVSS